MSSDGETQHAGRPMRVEVVFWVQDERQGEALAARMIDSAQEIANLPDCECDLDVSVDWDSPAAPAPPIPPVG